MDYSDLVSVVILLLFWSYSQTSAQNGMMMMCPALAPAETRCVDIEEAINDSIVHEACIDSIQHTQLYLYFSDYACLNDLIDMLDVAVISTKISEFCEQVLRAYVCNYVYPGCTMSERNDRPQGICHEDCNRYLLGESCQTEFLFLENLAENSGEFGFQRQCNNTLMFVSEAGLNVSTSEGQNCTQISGAITATEATRPPSVNQPTTEAPGEVSVLAIIIPIGFTVFFCLVLIVFLLLVYFRVKYRHKSGSLLNNSSSDNHRPSILSNYYFLRRHSVMEQDGVALFEMNTEDIAILEGPDLQCVLLPFERLEIVEQIGQGAFGCVFKGLYRQNLEDGHVKVIEVAVKTIKNANSSHTELVGFIQESALMCNFNHPHVLGMVGVCLDPGNSPYLLLPYMENGDLRSFLKKKRNELDTTTLSYPEGLGHDDLVEMCYEVASGMEYLALNKLVHRDLAARNCMVDKDRRVRVADFGLTRDIYETDYYRQHHHTRVPVKWMAPESLHDRISNEKTDVWSYGVTCWEVFSLGRTPYPTISNAEMLDYLERGMRLKQPTLCSNSMYVLMANCWRVKPEDRPTFAEIIQKFPSFLLHEPQEENDSPTEVEDMSSEVLDDSTFKPAFTDEDKDDSLFTSIFNLLPESYKSCSEETFAMSTDNKVEEVEGYFNSMMAAASNDYMNAPAHVKQLSNTSDYFPMYPAAPAKPL